MSQVLPPLSMPSTLVSNQYTLHYHLPPLPQKRDVPPLDADSYKRLQVDQNSVTHWLQTSATVDHGLRTPPREMMGINGNPLLAPNMGGLPYKSVPAARSTTSYSTSLDTVANNKYHSKAPPSHDSYRSIARPQSPIFQPGNAARGQRTRNPVDSTSIAPYLQIPATINNSKGSLAEFAAQVCSPGTLSVQLPMPPDYMPVLVRILLYPPTRRRIEKHPHAFNPPYTRSNPCDGISKMGHYHSFDHSGDAKRHPLGFDVHIPVEAAQSGRQREARK